jgi:hypothetical protein
MEWLHSLRQLYTNAICNRYLQATPSGGCPLVLSFWYKPRVCGMRGWPVHISTHTSNVIIIHWVTLQAFWHFPMRSSKTVWGFWYTLSRIPWVGNLTEEKSFVFNKYDDFGSHRVAKIESSNFLKMMQWSALLHDDDLPSKIYRWALLMPHWQHILPNMASGDVPPWESLAFRYVNPEKQNESGWYFVTISSSESSSVCDTNCLLSYFFTRYLSSVARLLTPRQCHSSGRFVADFPPRRPGFKPRSGHVGFVDKVALGQVFSEYFGFPCQFSFHRLHIHHHPRLVQ